MPDNHQPETASEHAAQSAPNDTNDTGATASSSTPSDTTLSSTPSDTAPIAPSDTAPSSTPSTTAPTSTSVAPKPPRARSSTVAGLLDVTLGAFGVGDWYMGRTLFAILHTILAGLGIIFLIASAISYQSTYGSLSWLPLPQTGSSAIFNVFAYLFILGSAAWGAVEGFLILAGGDARLEKFHVPTANSIANGTITAPRPMSQATKRIFLFAGIGVGGVAILSLGFWAIFSLLFSVDYGASYLAAKELRTPIRSLYGDSDCAYVVEYVDNDWTSEKTYNNYIDNCLETLDELPGKIAALGDSPAVKKDSEISDQFQKFETAYGKFLPNAAKAKDNIALYRAWHTFVYRSDDWNANAGDKETEKVVEPLVSSDNEEFKKFAEGWLELANKYRNVYADYMGKPLSGNSSTQPSSDSGNKTTYSDVSAASNTLSRYENNEAPDLDDLEPFDIEQIRSVYNQFNTLYNLISDAYEKHYDDSGECSKSSSGIVTCR